MNRRQRWPAGPEVKPRDAGAMDLKRQGFVVGSARLVPVDESYFTHVNVARCNGRQNGLVSFSLRDK